MAKTEKKTQGKYSPQILNKKALFNYEMVEKVEAGIALLGTEVKSLRQGLCELDGSYARIRNGEMWLVGAKIAAYEKASIMNHEPMRDRKLLLHKRQITKITSKLDQGGQSGGLTLVPIKVYFNARGIAKVEIALARGKRQYDKREKIKEREQKKDISRSVKKYKR
ncbi:MAG: SsrA-binding protein [Planctomycetes bacterium GWC2_49_10]|nr:MAG: SsrA-binding protein [Planctomycetes bacterium GWC2_49_10]